MKVNCGCCLMNLMASWHGHYVGKIMPQSFWRKGCGYLKDPCLYIVFSISWSGVEYSNMWISGVFEDSPPAKIHEWPKVS